MMASESNICFISSLCLFIWVKDQRMANHSQASQCQPISDKKNMAEDTAKNLPTQTPKSSRGCVFWINGVQNRSSWRDSHSERWDLGNWSNCTLFYKVRIRKRVSVRHQATRSHFNFQSPSKKYSFGKRMYDEEWCWGEREREREKTGLLQQMEVRVLQIISFQTGNGLWNEYTVSIFLQCEGLFFQHMDTNECWSKLRLPASVRERYN